MPLKQNNCEGDLRRLTVGSDLNSVRMEHPEASGSARKRSDPFDEIDATLGEMGKTLNSNNKTLREMGETLKNSSKTLEDTDEDLGKKDRPSRKNDETFRNSGMPLGQTENTLKEIDETLKEIDEGSEETRKIFVENENTQNNVKLRDAHMLLADPRANATTGPFASLNLRRQWHLQKGCQGLNAEPWYRMDYTQWSQVLDVCVPPKVRFR